MTQVIHYKTKPEATQRNTELIEAVFRDLAASKSDQVRYCVLKADDGTFFHIVSHVNEDDNSAVTSLPAFTAFQEGGDERRIGKPVFAEVTVVGNYRMLPEEAISAR